MTRGRSCRRLKRDNAEAPCDELPDESSPHQRIPCGGPAQTWICASRCRSLPVSTSCSSASRSVARAPEELSAATSLLGGMSTAGASLTLRSSARSNSAWATLWISACPRVLAAGASGVLAASTPMRSAGCCFPFCWLARCWRCC